MAKIKLVPWDVYGTLLDTRYGGETCDVPEMELHKFRENALKALKEIKSRGIIQCTCSDGDLGNLERYLKEARIDCRDFFYNRFDYKEQSPFKMVRGEQKDFSGIINHYNKKHSSNISFENLLVIGDNYDIDIKLAKQQGCKTLWVPQKENKIRISLNVQKICEILDKN